MSKEQRYAKHGAAHVEEAKRLNREFGTPMPRRRIIRHDGLLFVANGEAYSEEDNAAWLQAKMKQRMKGGE